MYFQLEPEIKQCWRKSTAPNGRALGGNSLINTGSSFLQRRSIGFWVAKIHSEHRGDKLKIYDALKTIVKKLSAISQATWSIHNQCNLLKCSGLCITAAWCWWKEMRRKRHFVLSKKCSKLCIAFTFDVGGHGNKTEFSRKVHNSGLHKPSLTLREAFWKCRFKPEGRFDLLYFLSFFSFCLSLFICQSVWPHTDICVWALTNTIYHDSAQHSKGNINQRSNTLAFSSQAK